MTPAALRPQDIQVGRCYEAKRPRRVGLFSSVWNDRAVLWVSPFGTQVQYDSPTVSLGRHYPRVSMEQFLKWAGRDVTPLMPETDWRPWGPAEQKGVQKT
jgi:hypothetical protein